MVYSEKGRYMKLKLFTFGALPLLLLTGCEAFQPIQQQPVVFQSANRVVENPIPIKTPKLQTPYQLAYGNDPALEKAYKRYLSTGKAANIITEGYVQFAYNSGQQPVVETSPFQLTTISLEPGERFTNVTSGDPNRWTYSAAISGSGATKQDHILIKPSQPNISTNFVITTNKRIYNIKAVAGDVGGNYMRNVRFWYPEDITEQLSVYNQREEDRLNQDTTVAKLPNLNVDNLNFDYSVSSGSWFSNGPSWKPSRVFDDGTHTYIQFPANMSYRDMPALFIQNDSKQELVNYRSKPPYFVVDKIFKDAVLVMGVGNSQQKVVIRNNRYS